MENRELALDVSAVDLPEGFALPDWSAPFDPGPYFDCVPAEATSKGMFLQALVEEAHRRGVTLPDEGPFQAFYDYPLARCMELTLEAAKLIHPDLSVREALRRIGRLSYGTFAESLIGRVVFGIAGRDMGRILKLASKGASIASTHGKIEVVDLQANTAMLRVSDVYVFAECFNTGIAESVFEVCGKQGIVAQRMSSLSDGEFWLQWA